MAATAEDHHTDKEEDHADRNQDADNTPDDLEFLLSRFCK